MYLLNRQEMKELDARAINQWHFPSLILMENAARSVTEALFNTYPDLLDRRIMFLCGPGNNGGDGLAVARMLHLKGAKVAVYIINEASDKKTSQDHAVNRKIIDHLSVRVFDIQREAQLRLLKANINHSDLLIDAMFGVGLNRPVSPLVREVITIVNEREVPVVAIDCPSGLNCDNGQAEGAVLQCQHTFTLSVPKMGFFCGLGREVCGELQVLDIGIPEEVVASMDIQTTVLTQENLKKAFPKRPKDCHKHQFGHVGIIAGSVGMSGAAVLAAKAALRAGAGLVSVLVDKRVYHEVATVLPEAMVRPVQWPSSSAVDWLLERADVVLIGPGLGLDEAKEETLRYLLDHADIPLVIDADGLTLLTRQPQTVLAEHTGEIILTPHPGEFRRLNPKEEGDDRSRLLMAKTYAAENGVTLVLKGFQTVVAAADGRSAVNGINTPALATAGSGDVLAGLVAAFVGQDRPCYEAAGLAVALHGQCGQRCAERFGENATLAGDLIEVIAEELRRGE